MFVIHNIEIYKMKKSILLLLLIVAGILTSCNEKPKETQPKKVEVDDERLSLELNAKQKDHQLVNMRDHLEAVQAIIALLAEDKYDIASKVAYKKLGSTTEMNKNASLQALSNTMNYCKQCHKTFRQ